MGIKTDNFPKLATQYGDNQKRLPLDEELLRRLKKFEGCQMSKEVFEEVRQTLKLFFAEYDIGPKDVPPIYVSYTNSQVESF